jgi:hypothetical protein
LNSTYLRKREHVSEKKRNKIGKAKRKEVGEGSQG